MRNLFLSCLIISAAFSHSFAARRVKTNEKGTVSENSQRPELARVSIVRYEDKTRSANFGYMPDSLTEAIDKSLQLKFEYLREAPDKTDAAITAFRKKHPNLNADSAADFCQANKTDILIFGYFEYDLLTGEIVVHTSISLGAKSKFRVLQERRNPVNATIFRLAEFVADDIVRTLTEIAREQAPEKQGVPTRKGEKLELKKTKSTAWGESNWNIVPGLTLAMPLNSSFKGYRDPQPLISLMIERRLWRGFYAGGMLSSLRVRASAISMDLYQAAALLGYHWQPFSRWDFYLLAGAGYYAGNYYNNATCTSNCQGTSASEALKIYNPYFVVRSGVNLLIFSWLSVGLFAQGDLFYDKPTPLYFAGGGLQIGVHF